MDTQKTDNIRLLKLDDDSLAIQLDSRGWLCVSKKQVFNKALKEIFGADRPFIRQTKSGAWYLDFPNGTSMRYFDGIVIGVCKKTGKALML